MNQSIKNLKDDWEDLAEMDPYWAILTNPDKQFGKWELEQFLSTGKQTVFWLMNKVRKFHLPKETGACLDFGCGVGRLASFFLEHFDTYCGVDISKNMIEKASQIHAGNPRMKFFAYDGTNLNLFKNNSFDLIYSRYVLQHLPDKNLMKLYIAELLGKLKEGGVFIFQVPSDLPGISKSWIGRRVYLWMKKLKFKKEFLYRYLKLNPMIMNHIAEHEVLETVRYSGGEVLDIKKELHGSREIESKVYVCKKTEKR